MMEQVLIAGVWQNSSDHLGGFRAADPTTGAAFGPEFPRSGVLDIEKTVMAAVQAAEALVEIDPNRIAQFLITYADAIDAAKDRLVSIALAETALPESPRLGDVELPRTSGQLRQAADATRSYAWTHPVIDTKAGLRASLAPLHKPVLIFGPNNFPFAFNAVAGSDFASAIAARNPVIAKAHPSHPATSRELAKLAQQAAIDSGLPAASVQMLYDFDSSLGLKLAGDRRIGAIGFTGSRMAGLALKAAADVVGIPIYAEMSSVNPVVLLPSALSERSDTLAHEFFLSCTTGSGQFCTNPGIVLLPEGAAGDAFLTQASALFSSSAPLVLFSEGVQTHLAAGVQALLSAGASIVVGQTEKVWPGWCYMPTLLSVDGSKFLSNAEALQQEVFGPVSLLVRYRSEEEAVAIIHRLDGNLTGAIFSAADGSEEHSYRIIASALRSRVGRLINNKWPTGVAVSAAMQHGGPYPSTSHAGFTSVGMPSAIRRFAQLQCYDNMRDEYLPVELRNDNPNNIQRLIDGVWDRRSLV